MRALAVLLLAGCATAPRGPPASQATVENVRPLDGPRVMALQTSDEGERARFTRALAERGITIDASMKALELPWVVALVGSCVEPSSFPPYVTVREITPARPPTPGTFALLVSRGDWDCDALFRDAAEAIDRAFTPPR